MAQCEDATKLREMFTDKVLSTKEFRGEQTLNVALADLFEVLAKCRNELGYELILDISSLDHFGDDPRFEMVYELATLDDSKHLRVKAKVGEEEKVPSVVSLWAGADWHEREVWDMMGDSVFGSPEFEADFDVGGLSVFPVEEGFPAGGSSD